MLNKIRKFFGYKFPRLGATANKLFFKIVDKEIKSELFPNIWVNLNLKDLTQQSTFWQGDRFEFPTPQILRDWGGVTPDCLFFDIGANYGFYSYFMYSSLRDIKCYAFEPNPKTFAMVKSIITENNLEKRVFAFNIGLGDKEEVLPLHPGVEDSGHSTFLPHPDFKDTSIGIINIEPFDIWREKNNIELPTKPKWVAKIDVEGFEMNVLKGMQKSLKSKAFIGISVEILESTLALNNNLPADIELYLNSVGYKKIPEVEILKRYKRINTANSYFIPS